jgi:nucleoside-diphosphate-sugar epimerase
MNDYYDPELKKYRLGLIEKAAENTPVKHVFIKGNLADKALINQIFEEYKPSIVVNLAAQAGVRYSITNPNAYIEANIIGFYNILEACRHNPVEHLVYASSSSVYGSNKEVLYSTDDKVDNPVSLYAATKKSDELLAHAYSKLYNILSTGLRFFTVYGPADVLIWHISVSQISCSRVRQFRFSTMETASVTLPMWMILWKA